MRCVGHRRMIPTRQTKDLLLGSWELIQQFGRVPCRLIWDNEAGIEQKGRVTQGVCAFAGITGRKCCEDGGMGALRLELTRAIPGDEAMSSAQNAQRHLAARQV